MKRVHNMCIISLLHRLEHVSSLSAEWLGNTSIVSVNWVTPTFTELLEHLHF